MSDSSSKQDAMTAALAEVAAEPLRLRAVAKPVAGEGEVLVRIQASGINPLDIKIHAGLAAHARHPLPAILGLDLAGIVEVVGPKVQGFRAGDEVYGMTGGVGGLQGSLAQFAAVDAHLLAPKPRNLSWRESATLPLVFITAWEGLVDRARVQEGQSVLIHGGAGGIGYIAIQLAASRGAKVAATGAIHHRETIERIGATFIDYSSERVDDYVDRLTGGVGFDVVFDTVGGSTLDASFAAIKRFGHVVSALGWGSHSLAPLSFRAGSYSGVFTLLPLLTGQGRAHHSDILREAARLAETGMLKPRLDPRRFTLKTANDAYAASADRSARGKLVIDIAENVE